MWPTSASIAAAGAKPFPSSIRRHAERLMADAAPSIVDIDAHRVVRQLAMHPGKTRLSRTLLIAIIAATLATAQSFKETKAANGAPPSTIPTFSTSDLSRAGIFYAGGKYVGEPGKEVMDGSA